ncbi:DUF4232 domain-containing protein [Nocardia panacis]|nr:DUF4232 domain-containing protein [Nocardia panacis]
MRLTAVAVLAFAAVATACGSGSNSSPGSLTQPGPSTPSAVATPGGSQPGPSSAPGSPDPAAPSPERPVSACTTSNLTVTLGRQEGAAGHIYAPLVFTNSGTEACTIYGYPGVSLAAGTPTATIGPGAARDTAEGAQTVTLAPGASAQATMRYTQAGNYPCERTKATALLIYPPDQTTAIAVPFTADACTAPPVALLTIGSVKPAA